MNHNWIFQLQSFLVLGLIWVGVYFRRNRLKHIRIMATAILWDLVLILQIEFSRNAIAKASRVVTNPMMLNIHVSLAITTVVFYVFMIITGTKILKGDSKARGIHKKIAMVTLALRTLTLITSFFAPVPGVS